VIGEMIVAILADLSQDWARRVRRATGERAAVLEATSPQATVELLQSVSADLIVCDLSQLTRPRINAFERMRAQAPDAVFVCIAPEEVIERVRLEGLQAPDLWLRDGMSDEDRDEVLAQAVETARLRGEAQALQEPTSEAAGVVHAHGQHASDLDAFQRLMSGLTGGFDLDRLLEAFVDAVSHFVRCASYCLLWEAPDGSLRVRSQRGVRAEIVEGACLRPHDALPTWYRRNPRVLTTAELSSWSDRRRAIQLRREMELFGGRLALPLMTCGRLAGILILGEKVLGAGYSGDEIETLFSVTNHVALAAQGIELHTELRRAKAYTDRIVESMGAGLITLGPDERIGVCNPYAAEVLGLERGEVEGGDLRMLPSPLGDMLYAALYAESGEGEAEEVAIHGGSTLRVTTTPVRDQSGVVLGSVLMLDDITAERELAEERTRRERLDMLTNIVGRIAHEVKNPLTAVKTYAELMSGRGSDERLVQFWSQTVLPEIDSLDEMLKSLLAMVEQPEPQVETARVEDLVAGAVDAVPMAEEIKRQSFDLRFDEHLPSVLVDPGATREALAYLLRYLAGSRPHPVQVEVTAGADEPPSVTVTMTRLSSADGEFDPDTIFDPIRAIQDPHTDIRPAISQRIIANQEGRLDASCDNGRVTMRVFLPGAGPEPQSSAEVQ